MIQNYSRLVEKLSKITGKEVEEINRLVEAKRAKLSGLISREGAAQIIAAELGINFDKEKVKVNELMEGMKKVNILGKIIQLFPVREFKKEDREGKVVNFILADETGNIRAVLWDTNHISLIENKKLQEEDVVEITNASLRNTELHLGSFSNIKKSNLVIEGVKVERDLAERKISELSLGGNFKVRAFIVQVFEPKFFEVCPECGSRVIDDVDSKRCTKHGKIIPKRRVLLSIVLDDGSSSIRAILFSEQIEKLGFKEEELENFIEKRNKLIGKEAFFSGNIRQNKLFNNLEFFVSDINDLDIDKLIEMLE